MEALIKEIEQRIVQLQKDMLINKGKKAMLIKENERFLRKCKELFVIEKMTKEG